MFPVNPAEVFVGFIKFNSDSGENNFCGSHAKVCSS